ncbi:MAG: CNP1-like family protein [Gammaproteobacteria bacterium]|jgi:hypothetical protein
MKYFSLTILLVLVLSVNAGSAYASRADDVGEVVGGHTRSLPDKANPFVEGEKWAETNVKIPDYPDDGDLIQLPVLDTANKLEYYIDEKSLSVSKDDYVVRYTMVIEGKHGSKNVFYEGIRCSTSEYKTYAFGNGKGKLRLSKKPEWKHVGSAGFTKFRAFLQDEYFCERIYPRPQQTIIDSMKYTPPNKEYHGVYNR